MPEGMTHADDPRGGTLPLDQTILPVLGIELVEATPTRVVATMPVDARVHQPYGFLHGGASVVLAETAMSVGAGLAAGPARRAFGIEINASHLKAKRSGQVTATATPLRVGRNVQFWQCDIVDEQGDRVCVSRCTLAIRDTDPA